MTTTKRDFSEKSEILAFRAIQAFMPGKITPEKRMRSTSIWPINCGVITLKRSSQHKLTKNIFTRTLSSTRSLLLTAKNVMTTKNPTMNSRKHLISYVLNTDFLLSHRKKKLMLYGMSRKIISLQNRSVIARDVEIALESSMTLKTKDTSGHLTHFIIHRLLSIHSKKRNMLNRCAN